MNVNCESVFESCKNLYGVGSDVASNLLIKSISSLESMIRNDHVLGETVENMNMGGIIPAVTVTGLAIVPALAASKVDEKYAGPLQIAAGLLMVAGLAVYYVTK